jgi:type III pantothenate kinase
MLLAVDVGNTNIVIGVFDGEKLAADFRLHTDDRATGDELGLVFTDLIEHANLSPEAVDAIVVSSVVPSLRSGSLLLSSQIGGASCRERV